MEGVEAPVGGVGGPVVGPPGGYAPARPVEGASWSSGSRTGSAADPETRRIDAVHVILRAWRRYYMRRAFSWVRKRLVRAVGVFAAVCWLLHFLEIRLLLEEEEAGREGG